MLNAFALSGFLVLATSAVMALVMLLQGLGKLQRLWGFFCLTVALWGLGAYQIAVASDPAVALFWWKTAYIGVIFIPFMFTHFVHLFLGIRNVYFTAGLYTLALFYLFANLATDSFIRDVHWMFGQFYYLSPTPLYNSFVLAFFSLVIYAHILLYRAYRHAAGTRRLQIQYFFTGTFLGFFGGGFAFLPVYQISVYPSLNMLVFLYPLIMGYYIARHRLMDIRVAATVLFLAALVLLLLGRKVARHAALVRTVIARPAAAGYLWLGFQALAHGPPAALRSLLREVVGALSTT